MLRSESLPTSPEPVVNRLPTVQELLPCFRDWLATQRDETKALVLLRALAEQSLRVAGSSDPQQLEFSTLDLVQACQWPEQHDSAAASKKVNAAKLDVYLSSRAQDRDAFFAKHSFQHALHAKKRSTPGRHRAQWFLEPYAIPPPAESIEDQSDGEPVQGGSGFSVRQIEYDYTPAGVVKPSWLARPLFGHGWFKTKSLRGLLFASPFLAPLAYIPILATTMLLLLSANRAVTTVDLVLLISVAGLGWLIWSVVRTLWWLVADRIIPASEGLLSWGEESAQLESFKKGDERAIGLVRYSATCPECAAAIELRYGDGHERRRLFGCCREAPQEHVFTFDRVTRRGTRVR